MGIVVSRGYADPDRAKEVPGLVCENLILAQTEEIVISAEVIRVYSAGFSFALVSRFPTGVRVFDRDRLGDVAATRRTEDSPNIDLSVACFDADGTALKVSRLGGRQSNLMHEVEYWVGFVPTAADGSLKFVAHCNGLCLEGSSTLDLIKLRAARDVTVAAFDK